MGTKEDPMIKKAIELMVNHFLNKPKIWKVLYHNYHYFLRPAATF